MASILAFHPLSPNSSFVEIMELLINGVWEARTILQTALPPPSVQILRGGPGSPQHAA